MDTTENTFRLTPKYLIAGKSTVTVKLPSGFHYSKDGTERTHYTYRCDYVEANGKYDSTVFVNLLVGGDNQQDYVCIGRFDPDYGDMVTIRRSQQWEPTLPYRLFKRILNRVYNNKQGDYEEKGFYTMHDGTCGRCGRTLTTPDSVEKGLGPICQQK